MLDRLIDPIVTSDASEKGTSSHICHVSPGNTSEMMRLEQEVDKAPHIPSHRSTRKRLPTVNARLPHHTTKVRQCLHILNEA